MPPPKVMGPESVMPPVLAVAETRPPTVPWKASGPALASVALAPAPVVESVTGAGVFN